MKDGWKVVELGEVAKVKGGKRLPKGSDYSEKKTNYPYIRVKDFHNLSIDTSNLKFLEKETHEKIKRYTISKDDIYISIAGTIGRVGSIPEKIDGANLTENAAKITGIIKFDKNFIIHYLSSPLGKEQISRSTKATSQPKLAIYRIESLKLPLPPLPEQQKIVAKIESLFSELDNGIANLKAAQAKLTIYRQSVLKKAFEGELTKAWRDRQTDLPDAETLLAQIKAERIRYYEMEIMAWKEAVKVWEKEGKVGGKPKKPGKGKEFEIITEDNVQNLIELPNSWLYLQLENITTIVGDGLHGTPEYDNDGEYYFINGNNLNNGEIIFKSNTKKVNQVEFLKYRKPLNHRTVFVSINGTLGNTAFYNDEKVILGKSACYFNLLGIINKNYIQLLISSQSFKNYADKTATGSTIKNVPLQAIRSYKIPLCSLAEQAQIVQAIESRLNAADEVLASIEGSLEKAEALRQSILKQAFEGKLV